MKVMTIVGTRPEIIKLSSVIKEFDRCFEHVLVHTGQNYDYGLNEVFFKDLKIRKPDHFMECAGSGAVDTISRVLVATEKVLTQVKPQAVLIYGDTNSALAAIAVKKAQIPLFHMEAGNRCFDDRVPEEVNRRLVDHISDVNMPLTERGRRNLLREGYPEQRIFKTGSCMREVLDQVRSEIESSTVLSALGLKADQFYVVSAHREENVDRPEVLKNLMDGLNQLAESDGYPVLFSVHPRTRKRLADSKLAGFHKLVRLSEPLGFCDYVHLQKTARAVLSDSGTLMEESAILGFPAVHLREAYERQEGMEHGTLVISPIQSQRLLEAVRMVTSTPRPDGILVEDYAYTNVAQSVARIVSSHVALINRTVYFK